MKRYRQCLEREYEMAIQVCDVVAARFMSIRSESGTLEIGLCYRALHIRILPLFARD